MNRLFSIPFLAAIAVLGLTACGDGNDVVETIDRQVEQFSLNDQWQGSCRNQRFDAFGVASASEFYDFGDALTKVTLLYAADGCAEPVVEIRETGTYTLGDTITGDIRQLDLAYANASLKPLTPNAANALNAINACGASDWAAGRARDITAQTGDPLTTRCWSSTPRTVYEAIAFSADRMRLGLQDGASDKTSPEARPAAVDESYVFARQ